MALIINKETTIFGNITIPQIYIRFESAVNMDGDRLVIKGKVYPSEESYKMDPSKFLQDSLYLDDDINGEKDLLLQTVTYNREIDGGDLLSFCHNKVIADLIYQETEERMIIDPSTYEAVLDPSTGEPMYETVVTKPAFAKIEDIVNTLEAGE
jgi:hypothetical protein